MQVWQDTFKELKAQYTLRSVERLEQIEDTLNALAKQPANFTLLRDLMRQFHWLAGSGGIYGYPQISRLGTIGETFCEDLLETNNPITKQQWDKCKATLEALRTAFDATGIDQRVTIEKEVVPSVVPSVDALLIESDQGNFMMLTRLLEEQGMAVRASATGNEAFASVSDRMPRALIMGMPLSDGSGYDLVEKIRSMPGGQDPVIFMVSNEAGFLDKVQAIHCGVDGYFESPIDWDSLTTRLKYLLDRNKPGQYRILSVEDDPDQAEFIQAVLEDAGYQVKVVSNPVNFEESLLAMQPDLVLLDIMLPGMTGFELAKYLRQHERFATLPILFLSTMNQLRDHIESAKAGGDDHLIKPIAPQLLLSCVESRLERARFLKNLLHRDGLTKLLTHGAFMESAQAVISQCKRNREKLALMFMADIDNLHHINTRYGYAVGDKVLVSLANLFRERLRQSDTIGRYGGEEVVVILEDLEERDAVALASRLLADFTKIEHRARDGSTFHASFSAGVAMLDAQLMDVDRWRKLAYHAVSAAKAAGKNCVMKAEVGRR